MITEQECIITALRAADITKDDWEYDILNSITSQFVRGYIAGRVAGSYNFDFRREDARDTLISWLGDNIWK